MIDNACMTAEEKADNAMRDCTIAHDMFDELLEFGGDEDSYASLVERFVNVFGRVVNYAAETRKDDTEDPTETAFYMIDREKNAVARIYARKT